MLLQILSLFLMLQQGYGSNVAVNKPIKAKDVSYNLSGIYVDGLNSTCAPSPFVAFSFAWVLIDLQGRFDISAYSILSLDGVKVATTMIVQISETDPFLNENPTKPRPSGCTCFNQSINIAVSGSCSCTGRFVNINIFSGTLTGFCEIEIIGTTNGDPILRYEFTKQPSPLYGHLDEHTVADPQACAEYCIRYYTTCIGVQYVPSISRCFIWTSILEVGQQYDATSTIYGLTHIITCD